MLPFHIDFSLCNVILGSFFLKTWTFISFIAAISRLYNCYLLVPRHIMFLMLLVNIY